MKAKRGAKRGAFVSPNEKAKGILWDFTYLCWANPNFYQLLVKFCRFFCVLGYNAIDEDCAFRVQPMHRENTIETVIDEPIGEDS
jgi:hypothetical protein